MIALLNVLPEVPELYLRDGSGTDTEAAGKILLRDAAPECSNLADGAICQMRAGMSFPSDDRWVVETSPYRMAHIVPFSKPLQVVEMIVQLVAVLVVHFHAWVWRWAKKGENYQSTNSAVTNQPSTLQRHLCVAPTRDLMPQWVGNTRAGENIDTAYLPQVGCFIPALPLWDRSPLFFNSINHKAILPCSI